MRVLFFSPRKPDESSAWLTNLRQVSATDLLSGDSLAPGTWQAMQKNKNLAEQFMRDKSFLCAKVPLVGFPPKSQACSRLFTPALKTVEGDLGVYQAALIACVHLLPTPTARALLLSLKPVPGHLDDNLLPIYLGTILMARQANPSVCTAAEADAAAELLGVVMWPDIDSFPFPALDSFPPITRLLEAVGTMACENLLPLTLVEQVLAAWSYQKSLAHELNKMRVQCRWYEAERLVKGLGTVLALPRVAGMARDIFPSHKMWAAWKPPRYRIEHWRSPHLEPHRDALIYILNLEGPDSTSKCAATLGIAKYGKVETRLDGRCHRTLRILDRCIDVGPGTVALLAALTADAPIPLIDSTHDLVSAAVDANRDSASSALAAFILAKPRLFSDEICPVAQMNLFAALIPVLTRYPHLRHRFIKPWDLAPQAAHALGIGANHLRGAADASALVTAIVALAEALLAATWLHACPWSDEFLGMLPRVVDALGMWPGKETPPSKAYVGWLETTVSHGIVGVPKVPHAKSMSEGRKPPPDPPAAPKGSKKKKKSIRVVEDQIESGPSVAPKKKKEVVVLGSKPSGDEGFLGAVLEEEEEEEEVRSEARPATRGKETTVVTNKKTAGGEGKGPGKTPSAVEKMKRAANTLARMRRDIQEKWEEVQKTVNWMLDEPGDEEFCRFDVLSMIIEEEDG